MRTTATVRRHRMLRSTAGATALALLAGGVVTVGLVVGVAPAQAATIPTNPCVRPEPVPVTTAPVVTRVSTSRRIVDVRRRAKTLFVAVEAHDSVAVTSAIVTVSYTPPSGKGVRLSAPATLLSGTATAGTWRASVVLPRFIPSGLYRVERVKLRDSGGGVVVAHRSTLAPGAWPARLRVLSYTDLTAPIVSGFRVSARAVDTRTKTQPITLRVRVRDSLSGVAAVRVGAAAVRHGHAATPAPIGFTARLARSTTRPHVWTGRGVVPMWAGTRTWLMSIRVTDRRGNRRTLYAPALSRRGWQSSLRVTSRTDTVQPSLLALSFTPSTVDARTGDVRVDVTFRVTDSLSGPSDGTELYAGPAGLEGPIVVTSVSGPPADRAFVGYLVVPRCGRAAQSSWHASALLVDNALNERWVSTEQLAGLGLPSQLPVRQRDSVEPGIDPAVILTAGGSLPLRFSEPVLMAGPMSAMLRVAVNGATAAGTWVCRNGTDDGVACDADDAAVVNATFTPTTAFAAGQRVTLSRVTVPPARIGIYDLDGVPLTQIGVDTIVR